MDNITKPYEISRLTNRISHKNTPWILFFIGIIMLFVELIIIQTIGVIFIATAFFKGGKEYGHQLGFKDGWDQHQNKGKD